MTTTEMSGMDRLTDAELFYWEYSGTPSERIMARELLAHRRASQAAPAPVAWLVEDLHGASSPPIFATISRKHVEGIFSDPGEFKVTPLYATPAPSDGLREALAALEAKASAVSSAHARKGGIGFAVAEMGPAIIAARAVLSASPAQEGKGQLTDRQLRDQITGGGR